MPINRLLLTPLFFSHLPFRPPQGNLSQTACHQPSRCSSSLHKTRGNSYWTLGSYVRQTLHAAVLFAAACMCQAGEVEVRGQASSNNAYALRLMVSERLASGWGFGGEYQFERPQHGYAEKWDYGMVNVDYRWQLNPANQLYLGFDKLYLPNGDSNRPYVMHHYTFNDDWDLYSRYRFQRNKYVTPGTDGHARHLMSDRLDFWLNYRVNDQLGMTYNPILIYAESNHRLGNGKRFAQEHNLQLVYTGHARTGMPFVEVGWGDRKAPRRNAAPEDIWHFRLGYRVNF